MTDNNLLSKELAFISREAQTYVIDAIHCTLFNKGNNLAGNTAEHDVDWFACQIWHELHSGCNWSLWDALSVEEREHWLDIARVCLNRLPLLMGRIASRCEVQAEALRSLMQADRIRT